MNRLPLPDEQLLRSFGLVRAVGAAAWFVGVAVLLGLFGTEVWPLALGVPVLAVVTALYFRRFGHYPRAAVVASLVADAVVLGGAVAYLGGTGSGLILLYSIVVISAGILLGPAAATGFTVLSVLLALLQLLVEQLGRPPVLLHRADLSERLPVLLVSLAGLIAVGYLTATYGGRLHELLAEAGERAESVRRRGRRRRTFTDRALVDVREPLRRLDEVAEALGDGGPLDEGERRALAARLRMTVAALDGELAQLADVGVIDDDERRPEPVSLRRAVDDCLLDLADSLRDHDVTVDVDALKVVGDRRGIRRVVFNLLENAAVHTPAGTHVLVAAVPTAGSAVLAVADDGPGVPAELASGLFLPPADGADGLPKVGLPLVAQLCEAMGGEVRYEPPPGGGARFLVRLRLAPSGVPSADEPQRQGAPL